MGAVGLRTQKGIGAEERGEGWGGVATQKGMGAEGREMGVVTSLREMLIVTEVKSQKKACELCRCLRIQYSMLGAELRFSYTLLLAVVLLERATLRRKQ